MLKRQFTEGDSNHSSFDLEGMGIYSSNIDPSKHDHQSDIGDQYDRTPRNDHMFCSPQRKMMLVGQPTPMKAFPPGFTPFSPPRPNATVQDNISTKKKVSTRNISQKLQFEDSDREDARRRVQQTPPHKKLKVDEQFSVAQRTVKRRFNSHVEQGRPFRKRRETYLPDYVQTSEAKSFKGLRNLACNVKAVATNLGVATCKEIAESLTRQLQDQKQIAPNSKQQQNIKRRVYDALKVLVAAEILQKSGKNIVTAAHEGRSRIEQDQYKLLKERVIQSQKNIEEKFEKLLVLNNKLVVNQQLIQYNKDNPVPPQQRLYFPLVGLYTAEQNINSISQDGRSTVLTINQGSFRLVGDIDMVMRLRMQQIPSMGDSSQRRGVVLNSMGEEADY